MKIKLLRKIILSVFLSYISVFPTFFYFFKYINIDTKIVLLPTPLGDFIKCFRKECSFPNIAFENSHIR